eukprot:CAMPEP_0183398154 /NCGR_PEP_ID=MMETSP0370-20130417/11069_1 /TAXON_ID=268820 /ORGANISM="Peridinium aciculiferum, Strain PAER-2" /LENGTH=42 /DNA_ID= /DNA_START= /DNA_END= /DNA_ORIENTATION=
MILEKTSTDMDKLREAFTEAPLSSPRQGQGPGQWQHSDKGTA